MGLLLGEIDVRPSQRHEPLIAAVSESPRTDAAAAIIRRSNSSLPRSPTATSSASLSGKWLYAALGDTPTDPATARKDTASAPSRRRISKASSSSALRRSPWWYESEDLDTVHILAVILTEYEQCSDGLPVPRRPRERFATRLSAAWARSWPVGAGGSLDLRRCHRGRRWARISVVPDAEVRWVQRPRQSVRPGRKPCSRTTSASGTRRRPWSSPLQGECKPSATTTATALVASIEGHASVAKVVSYWTSGRPASLSGEDGRSGEVLVFADAESTPTSWGTRSPLPTTVRSGGPGAALQVAVGGLGVVDKADEQQDSIRPGPGRGDRRSCDPCLLLFVFGSTFRQCCPFPSRWARSWALFRPVAHLVSHRRLGFRTQPHHRTGSRARDRLFAADRQPVPRRVGAGPGVDVAVAPNGVHCRANGHAVGSTSASSWSRCCSFPSTSSNPSATQASSPLRWPLFRR